MRSTASGWGAFFALPYRLLVGLKRRLALARIDAEIAYREEQRRQEWRSLDRERENRH